MAADSTPLMKQYNNLKKNYPEHVLLFQMGDFYETFYDDAKFISKSLGIVLTSREKENPVPMAGFPIKALNEYLPKLIKTGEKIAVAEQVEDPQASKGIVKRSVTKVITPGTVVMDEALSAKEHNYLAALFVQRVTKKGLHNVGLAFAEATTGEFKVASFEQITPEQLTQYLQSINPAEIIVPDNKSFEFLNQFVLQPIPAKDFSYEGSLQKLKEHFSVANLDGFGISHLQTGITAAGVVLSYIMQTQQQNPEHIQKITEWLPQQYLKVDPISSHNLDLFYNHRGSDQHSLINVLDSTQTAMGARLLRSWLRYPLISPRKIKERQEIVEQFYQQPEFLQQLRQELDNVYDLARLSGHIGLLHISPSQVIALQKSLTHLVSIIELLKKNKFQPNQVIKQPDKEELNKLSNKLSNSIKENPNNEITQGGIFQTDFHPQIKELRTLTQDTNQTLDDIIKREKSKHNIATMKIGFNKVFGYYIEIPHTHKDKVPDSYTRKQTLVNAERYITKELKELEQKILSAEEKLCALEYELYSKFRQELKEFLPTLDKAAQFIATLDVLSSFAHNALESNYCKPQLLPADKHIIQIKEGRHPLVEIFDRNEFIPNDTVLNNKEQNFVILTGPNMSGKSTYIRQIALLIIMAQIGSYIPASSAQISVVDKIFARIGANDDVATGRSTFMVEMSEAANIINNATPESLIILDELGRGTSTFDGLSLAWAIAKYIHEKIGAKTIFATHYHEITGLADEYNGMQNYTVDVQEDDKDVLFLHTIKPGKTDKSYGIYVAKMVGLANQIIKDANAILQDLESQKSKRVLVKQPTFFGTNNPAPDPKDTKAKEITDKISKVDLNSTTPLQALTILKELQDDIDNDSDT